MANYYATCRSNYVRAKNPKRFKELLLEYDVQIIEDDEERIGFISHMDTGMPCHNSTGDHIDHDAERVGKHLAEGETLVIMEVGAEKMRYLNGYAVAINWDGRVCHTYLDEIYSRASANFGTKPTKAEY